MTTADLTFVLDPIAAAEVAKSHRDAPRLGSGPVGTAYAVLARETDRLFELITQGHRPINVFFTMCTEPYADADELIRSIRFDRMLEITTAASERDRRHPLMDNGSGGAYDRFRAVHDVLGHGYLEVGFDREGEYSAWRFQERLHSPLARQVLATELHAEDSVRWTTGDLSEHKAVILDQRVIARSRAGLRGERARCPSDVVQYRVP
jgi:hypothetical protein